MRYTVITQWNPANSTLFIYLLSTRIPVKIAKVSYYLNLKGTKNKNVKMEVQTMSC